MGILSFRKKYVAAFTFVHAFLSLQSLEIRKKKKKRKRYIMHYVNLHMKISEPEIKTKNNLILYLKVVPIVPIWILEAGQLQMTV